MKCEDVQRQIREAVDPETLAALESHLADCAECRAIRTSESELSELLSGDMPMPTIPAGAVDAVIGDLDREPTREPIRWPALLKVAAIVVLGLGVVFLMQRNGEGDSEAAPESMAGAHEETVEPTEESFVAQLDRDLDLAKEIERTGMDVTSAVRFLAAQL